VAVVELGGDGNEFASDTDERILVGLNFGVAAFEKFDPRVNKEGAEDIDEPVEAIDESDAGKDEEGTKKESSDDAPEKGGELSFFGDGEIGEENGEDKNVIYTEGEFDDVAGKEFHGGLGAEGEGDDHTEGQGEGDPAGSGLERAAKIDGAGVAMEEDQVGREEGEDERSEKNPAEMKMRDFHGVTW